MKTILYWVLALSALLTFVSCEHNVSMETVVHEDGSLDRTIILDKSDSSHITKNVFGINEHSGWEVQVDKMISQKDDDKLVITFRKHFVSVEEANREMNTSSDTLFHITSTFEKKFRWFYTYLRYADNYGALNRFNYLPDDYLTEEDFAFIDRLPAEGRSISKADSLYLHRLNEKIYDLYVPRAFFEEHYKALTNIIEKQRIEQRWLDTLAFRKENIFKELIKRKDVEDDFLLRYADSLGVPFAQPESTNKFKVMLAELESRSNFMSYSNDAKYMNTIRMPWSVIRTNADSVSGSQLFWRPPVTKFLFRDFEMYGESRRMNIWAVVVSAVVVMLTVYWMIRKKGR